MTKRMIQVREHYDQQDQSGREVSMASVKSRLPANERYSVTLVPPAVEAINKLVEATGLTKTDVINRAVQIYAFLEERMGEGNEVVLRSPEGEYERVHIV
ncbi:hypothetical protein ACFXC0_26255 [Streptomyces althioticus]|nr:hypothetical protein [Actinospica acidiphila]